MNLLTCSSCSFTDCPKRGAGPEGYCWYEFFDESSDLDDFDKVRKVMRETIKAQRLMHKRLLRALVLRHTDIIDSDGRFQGDMVSEIHRLEDSLVKNLKSLAELCGWQQIKTEGTQKEKLKLLGKMFDLQEKTEANPDERTFADVAEVSEIVLTKEGKKTLAEIKREKAINSKYIKLDLNEDDEDET